MNYSDYFGIDLQSLVLQRLQSNQMTPRSLLKKMGYPPQSSAFDKAIVRLENVLTSADMGLLTPSYDFKYSSYEFIDKLCQVLSIDPETYIPALQELDQQAQLIKYSKMPLVRAGIKFNERFNRSFMGYLSVSRYIQVRLDERIKLLDTNSQITEIHKAVLQHYESNKDKIPFEGEIKGYRVVLDSSSNQKTIYIDKYELDA